jgi:hypothetical protein
MLMQKMVLGPRLGSVMASACEFEWAILLLIEAHPQAKKLSRDYRQRAATSNGFAKLSKLLSILMSSCGIRRPDDEDYLRRCLLLRNMLVHGSYRNAAETLSEMPQLRVLEENVVSFDPPRAFPVPSFETALEEAMMFANEPRLGAAMIEAFDAGCILLHLRIDQHYAKKLGTSPTMTVNEPGAAKKPADPRPADAAEQADEADDPAAGEP